MDLFPYEDSLVRIFLSYVWDILWNMKIWDENGEIFLLVLLFMRLFVFVNETVMWFAINKPFMETGYLVYPFSMNDIHLGGVAETLVFFRE